ncbi:hypothetical protein SGPA1_12654 [Streptomyces misionensis JCM 4497]
MRTPAIKPLITVFDHYARIAPRLPLVGVDGQARLLTACYRCGGGHGTVTREPASRACGARERVHALSLRPHRPLWLPLTCERSPLSRVNAQGEFACRRTFLILRRPLQPAATSRIVTSGDQLNASRMKITHHPTS